MNLQKHQLYLFEQHSESLNFLSAFIRINEGKSLIMKLGPDYLNLYMYYEAQPFHLHF